MLGQLIGGAFGLLAAWIAIGGRAHRERAAIKDELEILRLLDSQHPQRSELEEHSERRLEGYLHPAELDERFVWQGLVIAALISLVLLNAWDLIGLEPASQLGQAVLGLGTAIASVLLMAAGRLAYIWVRPAKRAALLARMRAAREPD